MDDMIKGSENKYIPTIIISPEDEVRLKELTKPHVVGNYEEAFIIGGNDVPNKRINRKGSGSEWQVKDILRPYAMYLPKGSMDIIVGELMKVIKHIKQKKP